jgi:DNA primase
MSSTTEKIKDRLSIVEVLSSYITIEKAGGSLKARCPFHNEKTPSFFISPERNTYYCFGCGAKGDIFSFVQEFEHIDFLGALKILADKAGVEIEQTKSGVVDTKKRLFDCLETATLFFQQQLKGQTDALLYLKKRQLSIEMVRDWRLGFAPDDWYALGDYLKKHGFTEKEIEAAGLIKQGDKGRFYARFRGRIMFPIFDGSGRVVAFSGRILSSESEEAKYINSPETAVFEKSKILFGYHKAKKEIREKGFALLVEGQMDLLMSHEKGFGNTLASSGTAFTFEQAEIIKRLTDVLYIAYDADKAGQNAAFRAWQLALKSGLEVKAVYLPKGLDPADAIAQDPKIWADAVANAKNIIDYYIELLSLDKKQNDQILREKILPLIKSLSSSIDEARWLQIVSGKTGLPEQALREELLGIKAMSIETDTYVGAQTVKKASVDIDNTKKKAIMLLWNITERQDPQHETFRNALNNLLPDLEMFEQELAKEKEALLFEAQMHYANSPNINQMIKDTLYFLEEEMLKKKFADSMEKLKRAENVSDKETVERETKKCHDISLLLSHLKQKYFNN